MKNIIEKLRVTPVAFAERPVLSAFGAHQPWAIRTILELVTQRGVVGLAETYGDAQTVAKLDRCAELLSGIDTFDLAAIRDVSNGVLAEWSGEFSAGSPRTSRKTAAPRLYSALETAALDASSRALELPLHKLIGGKVRDLVPFSAYLFYKFGRHVGEVEDDCWGEVLTPQDVVREAEEMIRRHGFSCLKLKGGVLPPAEELDAIQQLHARFPDVPIRYDVNGNWRLETALEYVRKFEPYLDYFEDPVVDFQDMAEVQRSTALPLATNTCITALEDIPQAIASKSAQIILGDHHYWGGLYATLGLGKICEAWGLGLSMHSNSHLGVSLMAMCQTAAATSNLTYACDTHYSWLDYDVLAGGLLRFENGAIRVPDAPGLGVQLDPDALHRMHLDYRRAQIAQRDDVAEMLKHRPDWPTQRPRF